MSLLLRREGQGVARDFGPWCAALGYGGGTGPVAPSGPVGVPREEVPPGPGIVKRPNRKKAVGEGWVVKESSRREAATCAGRPEDKGEMRE